MSNPPSAIDLRPEDLRHRMDMATRLAYAIGDAHPDDAVQLMSAALTDLTNGRAWPDIFLNVREDAEWWAGTEPPEVLAAVLDAVLANLGNRSMHLETRKRLFMVLWRAFSPKDKAGFLTYAHGGRAA